MISKIKNIISNILATLGRELSGSVLKITFIINDIKKKTLNKKFYFLELFYFFQNLKKNLLKIKR